MANLKSRRRSKSFAVGDKVKVQYGLKGPTDKHKLDPYYVGPYVIKHVLQNGAYQLDQPSPIEYTWTDWNHGLTQILRSSRWMYIYSQ